MKFCNGHRQQMRTALEAHSLSGHALEDFQESPEKGDIR